MDRQHHHHYRPLLGVHLRHGELRVRRHPELGHDDPQQVRGGSGSTSLSGRQSSATGTTTPGVTNFGWNAGTTQYYAWAALEILPAAGGLSGSAADTISATGKAAGHKGGTSAADHISATGKVAGTKTAKGAAKDYISATGKAATANPQVVNQWAASYGQGTTFTRSPAHCSPAWWR